MVQSSYTVTGMTCQHCVSSVTEVITGIDGVAGVEVDLSTGSVSVTSERPIEQSAVRSAIEEAGFELVGSS